MTTHNLTTGPVGELIRAHEESWRQDHDGVKECWQFEDRLAVVLWLFDLVHNAQRTWRDGVLTGRRPYDREHEHVHLDLYQRWLRLSEQFLHPLEEFEKKYGLVEGGRDLHRCRREAREILEGWQSPVPPLRTHSDRPLNASELASQWKRVSRPVAQPSVPLDNPPDPDDLS